MALDGFIFDLDGVLLDSNPAHVKAWMGAFRRFGYGVEPDRLAVEMGKGGDKLVPNVLGEKAEERRGQALRAAEKEEFARVAMEDGLPVSPGGRDLLAELRRRRIRTALATSSSEDQLALAERTSGVKWRSLFDEVVTATDVTETKPAPDLVEAAVRKLQLTAAQCGMMGDSVWDAQAASRAGVTSLGVTRGGTSPQALIQSGVRMTYQDPSDVLAHLDEALACLSPGTAHADAAFLSRLMGAALAAAEEGLEEELEEGLSESELPVGCVVADGGGEILARAHDFSTRAHDRTAHGALEALRRASPLLRPGARDTLLVCTVEPCVMCTGAAIETDVDTIVFALAAPADHGTGRIVPSSHRSRQKPRVVGGVREQDSRRLLEKWLNHPQRNVGEGAYVRELLARG